MAPAFIPLEHQKTKFYQRERESKGFIELSEEQLSELARKVYKKQETMADTLPYGKEKTSKLERYQSTLQYLTSPYIHLDLRTFDERVAFLIMMLDPNLLTFKEFLKIDLISISKITEAKNEKERNRLTSMRNQTILAYQAAVREKIGFFDAKLLKYEELFFKRFFSEKELVTEVGMNSQDILIIKAKSLKDFNSISDKRYADLVHIAQTWLSLAPIKYNSNVAAYSVTEQKKLLGIIDTAEQLALFILLVDSDLDMLRIYEEESMMQNVESRIIEQFGYYNQELLPLERKFHDRFCPDKKISIWSK